MTAREVRRRGKLILVVGPSCAGKDTLIRWASDSLPRDLAVCYLELEITRALGPWGRHVPIDRDVFEDRKRAGYYVLDWNAHGSSYGVPAAARDALESGVSVVSVASRAVTDEARRLPWECHVIDVRAPFDVIRERLTARGREAGTDAEARLARVSQIEVSGANVHVVDNGGALVDSGRAFNAIISRLVAGDLTNAATDATTSGS